MKQMRLIVSLTVALAGSAVLVGNAQYTPSQADTENYRNKPCTDPWIGIAHMLAGGQAGGAYKVGDCAIGLYNRGSWNSYEELRRAVVAVRAANQAMGLTQAVVNIQGLRLQLRQNGTVLSSPLIGQDGASLIFDRASDLIGKGGAGIVAAGGGNAQHPAAIIAAGVRCLYADGTPIVAAGGGNFTLQSLGTGATQIAPGVFFLQK